MTINFWMEKEQVASAKAAGTLPVMEHIHACGLNVGDTISFPGFRPLAYRVASRHYRSGAEPGEPTWLIQLEPTEHPF